MAKYSLALHGGAGTILKSEMTPELETAYLTGLEQALQTGMSVLEKGGSSLDAVCETVKALEDNALFNAGKGSVFTNAGTHEMDAAIMEGYSLNAGAVAGVKNVRNPIQLALEIMKHSGHVFLCGEGALEFAGKQKIPIEPDSYFFSQYRYDQWLRVRETEVYKLDHSATDTKFGTVGAVALDIHGNLAAATSTGGMTNKKFGRVGDSPVIGTGTYANNKTCAISCTGHGEPFIRAVAAYDVSCLMEYRGLSLQEAMDIVVNKKLTDIEGEGGMIGIDRLGNVTMIFNCPGMYRAMQTSQGQKQIAIYK